MGSEVSVHLDASRPAAASDGVMVRPVLDRADAKAFSRLPFELYATDPFWVAPLASQERERWSEKRNPSLRNRWHRRFLAWRGRRPVGRVAAIRDDQFGDRWSPGAGFFGFFESENDPVTARALLGAAEAALAEMRCTHVYGPVNLTTHEEVGLLEESNGHRPMVLSPYNPPSYPTLVRAAGYAPAVELRSYEWRHELKPRDEVAGLRARRDPALTIRASDPKRWDEECRILGDLYNRSFTNVWGFVPLTRDEFRHRAESFRAFYRPDLVLFAEREGRPVGFALTLPDANEVLGPLRGRLWPFGWWRLMKGIPKIRAGRFILIGVDPDETGHGAAFELSYRMMEAVIRAGFTRAEISLILGLNERMNRITQTYGWPQVGLYRLYRKDLVQVEERAHWPDPGPSSLPP